MSFGVRDLSRNIPGDKSFLLDPSLIAFKSEIITL